MTRWTPVAELVETSSLVIAAMCALQTVGILFEHMEHPSAGLSATLRDDFQEWQGKEMTRIPNEVTRPRFLDQFSGDGSEGPQ